MTRPRNQQRRCDDHGRIALLVIVLAFAVLAMIGLSVDGGGKIRAIQRANNIASEAARSAGQAILASQAIQGGEKVIDPAQAIINAQTYLADAGVTGTVSLSDCTGGAGNGCRRVTVTVTIVYNTTFLGLIGINTLTATRQASAVLVAT